MIIPLQLQCPRHPPPPQTGERCLDEQEPGTTVLLSGQNLLRLRCPKERELGGGELREWSSHLAVVKNNAAIKVWKLLTSFWDWLVGHHLYF